LLCLLQKLLIFIATSIFLKTFRSSFWAHGPCLISIFNNWSN
jgi:hypothetical protein